MFWKSATNCQKANTVVKICTTICLQTRYSVRETAQLFVYRQLFFWEAAQLFICRQLPLWKPKQLFVHRRLPGIVLRTCATINIDSRRATTCPGQLLINATTPTISCGRWLYRAWKLRTPKIIRTARLFQLNRGGGLPSKNAKPNNLRYYAIKAVKESGASSLLTDINISTKKSNSHQRQEEK